MEAEAVVSDAVNYRGAPADRSSTGGWLSAASILVVELCERLSTMAIAVNLVTYLHGTMHLSSPTSSTIVTNWGGISFLLSLIGGILADSYLGRYWTIAIFANVHVLGSSLLTISTVVHTLHPPPCNPLQSPNICKQANTLQLGVFFLAIFTIAVGIGGIKCSVSGFGSDQFDQKNEKEMAQMTYFFNRFYFFISIGTLLAVTVFIYLQDRVARVWGYGSCTAIMFLSVAIFLSGTRRYRYKNCLGSPIVQILQVLVAAVRKRKVQVPPDEQQLHDDHSEESRLPRSKQFSCLDRAAIKDDKDELLIEAGTTNLWRLCTVTKVEEVKMMTRILPIWATTIMFYVVHAQMITYAVLQANTMKRSIGSFEIPGASFNAFFIGAILLTLGTYDRIIICISKKTGGTIGLTSIQKMGVGLFISILAMVVAAIVETRRLNVAIGVDSAGPALPISGFLLVPQFVLAGAGEGFVYTGQLAFFLTESPKGMKALSTSLFLTTISFGFFLSSALVAIVKKATQDKHDWLPSDINHGRLDLFYGFIALLSLVNLGLYLLSARWFQRKKTT
ncbi:protein NRT1/ PTR FAMILY 6.2-like [Andrographis paniculata]|uniref:protein NRT1/ PTR FAMILY 6.2-like n=1 Tax=Andrographis paniculata TaxID=175694 RepID=UPI0021E7ABB9|nr:protein NRT1/ PTR FAMILY 6.2-like [Andrographis paniculata]